MYIRVPIHLIKHNPFCNEITLLLYCYFANQAKEGKTTTTVFASNKHLDGVFDFAHSSYLKAFNDFCEKGFAVNRSGDPKFFKPTQRFVTKRNYLLDCELYQKYAEEEYMTVQSEWFTSWKLPVKASMMLGIMWSFANITKDPVVEFRRDYMRDLMGGMDEKTWRKHIKLLKELGLVTELNNQWDYYKKYRLNTPVLEDKENLDDLLESDHLMQVAKEVSTTTSTKKHFINWIKRVLKAKTSKVLEKVYAFLCPDKEIPSVVDKTPWEGLNWYEIQAVRESWKAEKEELDSLYHDIYGGYAY